MSHYAWPSMPWWEMVPIHGSCRQNTLHCLQKQQCLINWLHWCINWWEQNCWAMAWNWFSVVTFKKSIGWDIKLALCVAFETFYILHDWHELFHWTFTSLQKFWPTDDQKKKKICSVVSLYLIRSTNTTPILLNTGLQRKDVADRVEAANVNHYYSFCSRIVWTTNTLLDYQPWGCTDLLLGLVWSIANTNYCLAYFIVFTDNHDQSEICAVF